MHKGSRFHAGRPGPKPCISIMSPASEGKKGVESGLEGIHSNASGMPNSVPRAAALSYP